MIEALKLFDRSLLLMINSTHSPPLDVFMWYMSETWPTVAVVIVAALIIFKKYNVKKMAEFVLGCLIVLACTDFSTNTIKHAVKRYRPTHNTELKEKIRVINNYYGGQYGFSSGHSANNFGAITYIFLCLHWIKIRYRIWLYIFPLLVVYSRMYLGVHYPSDIIMGMFTGFFFGWLGYRIINKHFLKFDAQPA